MDKFQLKVCFHQFVPFSHSAANKLHNDHTSPNTNGIRNLVVVAVAVAVEVVAVESIVGIETGLHTCTVSVPGSDFACAPRQSPGVAGEAVLVREPPMLHTWPDLPGTIPVAAASHSFFLVVVLPEKFLPRSLHFPICAEPPVAKERTFLCSFWLFRLPAFSW